MSERKPEPGRGIRCLLCGSLTGVTETRANRGSLRRRRKCLAIGCPGRLSTVEMVAPVYSKLKTNTTNLVAVPRSDDEAYAVVPRKVVELLKQMLSMIRKSGELAVGPLGMSADNEPTPPNERGDA